MSPDAIIPVLLIVGFIVSLVMATVARQKVPGDQEYRLSRTATAGFDEPWTRPWGDTGMHSDFRRESGLGRGAGTAYARTASWPGREDRNHDGLGRGYGRGGYQDRRDRPRYHANGSSAHGRHEHHEDVHDSGFEAWARANGFHFRDASAPPPPPPPPATPHWSRVLDIPKTSGAKDIRAAYAKAMRGLHPDVAVQDAMTSQRCTDVRIAYEQGKKDAQDAGRP